MSIVMERDITISNDGRIEITAPEALAGARAHVVVMLGGPDPNRPQMAELLDSQGITPAPQLIQGWMVEPIARPTRQIWIWGAGHVGRALAQVLSPLPDLALTWVDTGPDRFPAAPLTARILPVPQPENAVPLAPRDAEHLILTYSHALDLALCHGLLTHGFATCGLIGSATKWARFRSRLTALGHSAPAIARITCPIGDPSLGKHPTAIAISVAHSLLSQPALFHTQEITGT